MALRADGASRLPRDGASRRQRQLGLGAVRRAETPMTLVSGASPITPPVLARLALLATIAFLGPGLPFPDRLLMYTNVHVHTRRILVPGLVMQYGCSIKHLSN